MQCTMIDWTSTSEVARRGPRVRCLILMSELNYWLDFSALTERLHNRLNNQAFLSPASVNSMKSESCVDYSIIAESRKKMVSEARCSDT